MLLSNRYSYRLDRTDKADNQNVDPNPCTKVKHQKVAFLDKSSMKNI